MLDKILSLLPDDKNRQVAYAGAGMLALLAGRKLTGLGLFAKGAYGLEKEWRKSHPEFSGGIEERFRRAIRFYEETHENDVNKKLHIIGIPMIVGGAMGLIVFPAYRPMWLASAASFTTGWVLNFIGHGIFEKKAPAFADDPLSFIAGPVWDLRQVFGKGTKVEVVQTPDGPINVVTIDAQA
jgi:hypothetical protein